MSGTSRSAGAATEHTGLQGVDPAFAHPFLDALGERASRRVGLGMSVPWEPLAYHSPYEPVPLCELEEAILVAAAVGNWGPALADLGDADGLGALVNWTSRSFPSPCNNQGTSLFISNDSGTWFVDANELNVSARTSDGAPAADLIVERYRRSLRQISSGRADLPTGPPGLFGFNAWNANQPGTSVFLPVTDLTTEYLNVLMVYLGPELRLTIVDDTAGGQPAGLSRFVESGRLDKDRRISIVGFEQRLLGIMATEAAFICQNLSLAQQCLGLGGFTYSAYNSLWSLGGMDVEGLGFRFATDAAGGRYPVGHDGLMEAYVPPYVASMSDAVDAFLERKLANRTAGAPTAFRGGDVAAPQISWPDDETIDMMKAYCEYVFDRFGRFPATLDPMYSRIVNQAHHVDPDFYADRHGNEALPIQHREHFAHWHPDLADDGGPPRRP